MTDPQFVVPRLSPVWRFEYDDGERGWHVRLPYVTPPLSANQRLHHMAKAKIVKQVRGDVAQLLRSLPKLDKVAVELHWTPARNGRRDEDNLAPLLKVCLDAMGPQRATRGGVHVGAGVIPDDTPRHVVSAVCRIDEARKDSPGMWLMVWDRS